MGMRGKRLVALNARGACVSAWVRTCVACMNVYRQNRRVPVRQTSILCSGILRMNVLSVNKKN